MLEKTLGGGGAPVTNDKKDSSDFYFQMAGGDFKPVETKKKVSEDAVEFSQITVMTKKKKGKKVILW